MGAAAAWNQGGRVVSGLSSRRKGHDRTYARTREERRASGSSVFLSSGGGLRSGPAGDRPPAAARGSPWHAQEQPAKITIDDFTKVDLRVGLVKAAERVKGADRLLRLEVDIGSEIRQIVAGIAETYAPEALIGRKVVIVANLQPRKLRGLESNGMIVAASLGEKGKPVLASFLEDIAIGARLK